MDNVTIYQPEQRDSFGQYQILPGHVHVFAFAPPMLGGIKLTIAHIMPNSQDFSIDLWISERPLDGLVLREGFGHLKANRRADVYEIYDLFMRHDDEDERLFLESHRSYYLNAKNLQNRINAYELTFDVISSPTP